MNGITMGIGALVLGGWMLNSSPENQVERTMPPVAAAGESATMGGTASTSGGPTGLDTEAQLKLRQYQQMQQQRRDLQQQPAPMQPGTQSGAQPYTPPTTKPMIAQPLGQPTQQSGRQQTTPMNSNSVLPLTPTESVRSTTLGMLGMPSSPTASLGDANIDAQAEAANLARGPGGAVMPSSPTGRTYAPRTYDTSTYTEMDQRRAMSQYNAHPGFAPTQPIEKPLANVRLNTNGVSPWMNLYRNNHDNGTVNNYYTLVKPALDQRSMNQQFSTDIYGAERNNRIQAAAMRQLNSANQRTLQSVGTPQFQMNYGNYYPGYGQQGQAVGQ